MAKSKYKEIYCNYCKRPAKMAILKEPEDNKGWFECSRCHHSFYIDLAAIELEKRAEKEIPLKENCTPYNPALEYSVGDPIYHAEWDDMGKVEAKKKLSNGSSSIVVKFQKSGTRFLIEKHVTVEDVLDDETVSAPAEKISANAVAGTKVEEPAEIHQTASDVSAEIENGEPEPEVEEDNK